MPNAAAGFFGKLPSAGDFVQRRLPSGFVEVWDRHFENLVAESRKMLSDGWHDAYRASPVWRFLLAPGVCGESAWAGILGPGADRVGRCFPMVIAAPLAAEAGTCARALVDGNAWFEAAEQVHQLAQASAASIDAFDEQVAGLAGPLEAAHAPAAEFLHGVDWVTAGHWRMPLPLQATPTSFLSELWLRLPPGAGRWCLWWTLGGGRVPASALVTNGLPQPQAYAGFLDADQGAAPWQSLGTFDSLPQPPPEPPASVAMATPGALSPPPVAWLPDDPELFSDLAAPTAMIAEVASSTAAPDTVAGAVDGVAVLHRADCQLTLVAAEVGARSVRQQAVAAVLRAVQDLPVSELAGGMQALRVRLMALNPPLRQRSEDLIDPVAEDCAVIAAHVAGGQADLLRIGTAAAWHWRHGRLQPFFAKSNAPPAAASGLEDDFDDLLFSRVSLAAPGLGATAQPTCSEVFCAVETGDRLLLMATQQLVQLPPEILARSLAMPSCDEARQRIATAAGLGTDPAGWPLAIIEIHV